MSSINSRVYPMPDIALEIVESTFWAQDLTCYME